MADAAAPPTIECYPPPPGAAPSDAYAMTANGQPVFVERYLDVCYARLAIEAAVELAIIAAVELAGVRVIPEAAVSAVSVRGDRVCIALRHPAHLVVFLERAGGVVDRLFVLADPRERERPSAGMPGVVTAVACGADPTGAALATTCLQRAIDELADRPGGGTLLLEAGVYRSGTLRLKSHVTLYLAAGAVLRGSRDPDDYPKDPGRREHGSDPTIEPADRRYLGEYMTFSRLLLVDGATGVRIRGRGTIDGDGSYLRKVCGAVPNLVRVRSSERVVIEDVLLRDAAAWTLHLLRSRDLRISNVKIINDRSNLNTDGIDPDSVRNVTIDRAFIYTKDDAIVVKASNNGDLLDDVSSVTVTRCVVSSIDAAIKLGSETQAARLSGITFDDIDIFDSGRAMSVVVRDGAVVEDVTFARIRIHGWTDHLIEQVIGERSGRTPTLGRITNLRFVDIDAPGYQPPPSNWTWYAQYRPDRPEPGALDVPVFAGADADHAVVGLTLRDVRVRGVWLRDAATGEQVAHLRIGPHVRDVTFE